MKIRALSLYPLFLLFGILYLTASSPVFATEVRITSVSIAPLEKPFSRTMLDGTVVLYDRLLTINGEGFFCTSRGLDLYFDDARAWGVELYDGGRRLTVYLPQGFERERKVRLVNPDGSSAETRARF
jgi:hypothetical protein